MYLALGLMQDVNLAVLILVFFTLYKQLTNSFIPDTKVALLVTIIITMLVAVPYIWIRYLLFFGLFLYTFPEYFGRHLDIGNY